LLFWRRSSELAPDVIDIIADHHELDPDFTSNKLPNSIPQVNALFILADAFCHEVQGEGVVSLTSFKANWVEFHERYHKGSFKKPLMALKEISDKTD